MKLLFYRTTHDKDGNYINDDRFNSILEKMGPCSPWIYHLLPSQQDGKGMSFNDLVKEVADYKRQYNMRVEDSSLHEDGTMTQAGKDRIWAELCFSIKYGIISCDYIGE